ncbi:hypothetical protein KKD49_16970 [Myxococcota bacterium]|nr:hypothetical protein [Myxococcota bacterium]
MSSFTAKRTSSFWQAISADESLMDFLLEFCDNNDYFSLVQSYRKRAARKGVLIPRTVRRFE